MTTSPKAPELPPLPVLGINTPEQASKWVAPLLAKLAEREGEISALRTGNLQLSAEICADDRKDKELDGMVELLKKCRECAEKAERERDLAIQQAQIHAQEARTANATIYEIYQFVAGSSGEPGNWNGARPVREAFDALRAQLEEARAILKKLVDADDYAERNGLDQILGAVTLAKEARVFFDAARAEKS